MRIVAISDTHGKHEQVTIPPCDLLIHAGDICPDKFGPFWARHEPKHQARWFRETFVPWLNRQPATRKIITWGNHDFCGLVMSDEPAVQGLVADVDSGLTVWCSPWSQTFMSWAFMKTPAELAEYYATIPTGVDILVTHQPPYGSGDSVLNLATGQMEHIGSPELRDAIARIQPKVVICGHLHRGYGQYECHGVPVFNVSVVDESYRVVNPATVLEWHDGRLVCP